MAAKFLWSPASLHPMAVMLSIVTFVLSIAISVLCCENFMPAKQGPKKRPAATPDANLNTLREIVSNGTKTGIAQTLVKLQSAGLLNADIADSNLRNVRQKLQGAEKKNMVSNAPHMGHSFKRCLCQSRTSNLGSLCTRLHCSIT